MKIGKKARTAEIDALKEAQVILANYKKEEYEDRKKSPHCGDRRSQGGTGDSRKLQKRREGRKRSRFPCAHPARMKLETIFMGDVSNDQGTWCAMKKKSSLCSLRCHLLH